MRAVCVYFDELELILKKDAPRSFLMTVLGVYGLTIHWTRPVDRLVFVAQVIDPDDRMWFPEVKPLEVLPTISFQEFMKKHNEWLNRGEENLEFSRPAWSQVDA